MKALTLREPWASLVACGAKTIETRSWSTKYRGPIAIHAAKGMTKDGLYTALRFIEDFGVLQERSLYLVDVPKVKDAFSDTRGCVIAVGILMRCERVEDVLRRHPGSADPLAPISAEFAFGNYAPGRYAWTLADVRELSEPIPATGALGLWQWDPPAGVL